MNQTSFPGLSGSDRKEIGQARVRRSTDPEWQKRFNAFVANARTRRDTFTAEDIRTKIGSPNRENAMGSAISKAASAGLIEPIGYCESTRPERNRGIIRVWKGIP